MVRICLSLSLSCLPCWAHVHMSTVRTNVCRRLLLCSHPCGSQGDAPSLPPSPSFLLASQPAPSTKWFSSLATYCNNLGSFLKLLKPGASSSDLVLLFHGGVMHLRSQMGDSLAHSEQRAPAKSRYKVQYGHRSSSIWLDSSSHRTSVGVMSLALLWAFHCSASDCLVSSPCSPLLFLDPKGQGAEKASWTARPS